MHSRYLLLKQLYILNLRTYTDALYLPYVSYTVIIYFRFVFIVFRVVFIYFPDSSWGIGTCPYRHPAACHKLSSSINPSAALFTPNLWFRGTDYQLTEDHS